LVFLRNNVLPNVIENTTSSSPRVMFLSLAIFFNLIKNYRNSLKEEIALFLNDVVLRMIDSVNNKAETKLYLIRVDHVHLVFGKHRGEL
jgi:Guanine nucleotide exchange factor in Golgi transport N-terminal